MKRAKKQPLSKKKKKTPNRRKKTVAILEPKTKEEYEKALKSAQGTVVVDFIQQGCDACDPKALEKLAGSCDGKTTVMRVDCTDGWGSAVADDFGVEGTPTTLLAKSGESFLKAAATDGPSDDIEEVDPADAATLRRIKCAR